MGTTYVLLAAARDGLTKVAVAALMTQWLRPAAAIHDYYRTSGNVRDAARVQQQVISTLHQVQLRGPLYERGGPDGQPEDPRGRRPPGRGPRPVGGTPCLTG